MIIKLNPKMVSLYNNGEGYFKRIYPLTDIHTDI